MDFIIVIVYMCLWGLGWKGFYIGSVSIKWKGGKMRREIDSL